MNGAGWRSEDAHFLTVPKRLPILVNLCTVSASGVLESQIGQNHLPKLEGNSDVNEEQEKSPGNEENEEENLRRIAEDATAPIREEDTTRSRLISQFVVFPIAIIVVALGIYLLLGLLTSEDRTARDYLDTIRIGGINSRWQAAYELPKVLAEEQKNGTVSPGFVGELIRVFDASRSDDVRVRRYLALAMGMVKDERCVPVLIEALEDPDDETRIFSMMSLSSQGDDRAIDPLIKLTSHNDGGIRKAAVWSLGKFQNQVVHTALVAALADRLPDVRWNAALQLAADGKSDGVEILAEMVNRSFLDQLTDMDEVQRSEVMIQGIRAIGALDARELQTTLQALRTGDISLKVRQASIEVLKAWSVE
jgi:HEAT repeat protein